MRMKAVLLKLIFINIFFFLATSRLVLTYAEPVTPTRPSAPQYGGIMRLSDQYDGISIGYPSKILRVYSYRQVAPVIETLFHYDTTGNIVPWLATGYTSDAAAKALTIMLRKGVKFHDGTDCNAQAVKWNIDDRMSSRRQGTEKFKSIDIIDDYTLRINLSEWDNTVIGNLAQTIGMIISPTAYKKNGEDWCAKNPVGTGPFQFVSWVRDVKTTYKKFDGYWQKGKPYLDGIEWTPIVDSSDRTLFHSYLQVCYPVIGV